jgi:hypothetical protein
LPPNSLRSKLPVMGADDLTPEQDAELFAKLHPMLGYLSLVRKRMERRRFPPDDPLRVEVEEAFNAMLKLTMDLHYRSYPGQGGKP